VRRLWKKNAANAASPKLKPSRHSRLSRPRRNLSINQRLRSPKLSSSSGLSNQTPIIVAGPTGVGKSAFAVELAHRLDGEILGADAYQVYSGLSILTAQPDLPGEVPHHLIGFLPPSEAFDAAAFVSRAQPLISEIQSRGRTPILVGGSGLYLKALTHGLDDVPPADPALRAELSALPADELRGRLDVLDPAAREVIDFQNPRRVMRALEICLLTGRSVAESRRAWASKDAPGFRGLLLHRDREELGARIVANVGAMFARGVVEEVRRLVGDCPALPHPALGPTAALAIGLREILALLRGEMSEPECQAAIVLATRQYAKRQLTWFRNQFNFSVIDLTRQRHHEALSSALNILGAA
jgi:tRNA dimethylallyltransferase